MKHLYTMAMFLACTLTATAQTESNALQLISFSKNENAISSGEGMGSQDMSSKSYWQSYSNDKMAEDGDPTNALMLIFVENMPDKELANIKVTEPNVTLKLASIDLREVNGKMCRAILVPGSKSGKKYDYIEVTYNGVKSRISEPTFITGEIYTANFSNPQRTSASINLYPQKAAYRMFFDESEITITDNPIVIPEINYGKHNITIFAKGDNVNRQTEKGVDITKENNSFNFDLRSSRSITIEDKSGANIQLVNDGYEIMGSGKGVIKLDSIKTGNYRILAPGKNFEKFITITNNSDKNISFRSTDQKPILITAFQNNEEIHGSISIDDNSADKLTPNTIDLEYGRHRIAVNYFGQSQSQFINVNKNSPNEYRLKLKSQYSSRHTWNPFDYDYHKRPVAFSFGYVQKHFVVAEKPKSGIGATNKYHYSNCMNKDKSQHGFQMGMAYAPYFGYGQGFSLGVYWQMFFTEDEYYDPNTDIEQDLYIPLEYRFRLPLSEEFSIFAGAGIAAQFGLSHKLYWDSEDGEEYEPENLGFGEEENDYGLAYPKEVQWYIPISFGLQWKALELNFRYSLGLTDNAKLYAWSSDSDFYNYTMKASMMEFNLNIVF